MLYLAYVSISIYFASIRILEYDYVANISNLNFGRDDYIRKLNFIFIYFMEIDTE